jgi:hypothetical protein
VTTKSAVHDNKVFFGHDRGRFVPQYWRSALDEIEQALAVGRDMSAVLNVPRDDTTMMLA